MVRALVIHDSKRHWLEFAALPRKGDKVRMGPTPDPYVTDITWKLHVDPDAPDAPPDTNLVFYPVILLRPL